MISVWDYPHEWIIHTAILQSVILQKILQADAVAGLRGDSLTCRWTHPFLLHFYENMWEESHNSCFILVCCKWADMLNECGLLQHTCLLPLFGTKLTIIKHLLKFRTTLQLFSPLFSPQTVYWEFIWIHWWRCIHGFTKSWISVRIYLFFSPKTEVFRNVQCVLLL